MPPRLEVCTAFLADGETVCARYALCTTVTVVAGGRRIVREVCDRCRERMELPDHDVELRAR